MREGFLNRIQGADAATKRRVLIISSAVAMVVVLYIWLAYFNNLLVDAGENTGLASGQEQQQASFWQTMQRGSAILYENVTGAIGRFGEMFKGSREYIVKPLK
ncbi:MAG: hypothetical protein HYY10_02675 [Candidatus Liptonbacteria bacterium]|nr:hypothetical protein [Candidatus Liptonbacteria bacterium]